MPSAPAVQLLHFEIAEWRVALLAAVVQEVVRMVACVPLPGVPSVVEGVINVRGALVPVLDLRQRFGLPPSPPSPDDHLIIAQSGSRLVALRVDRARDVLAVESRAIEPPAQLGTTADHVAGLARLPDGVIVIQDLERFLSHDEVVQLEAALDEAASGSGPAALDNRADA